MGANEIQPLPKDYDVSFWVTNSDRLPAGAAIKWTVRNKGNEAADRNELGDAALNCLTCDLSPIISSRCESNDETYWYGDCLLIRGMSFPATVLLGAEGMRMGDLVDHPLFNGNLSLTSGRSNGQHTGLFIERRYRYFRIPDWAVWGDDEIRLPDAFG